MNATFVVIGGGIAGVTCAETLAFYQPEREIVLVSESSLIKTVTNLLALTQNLTTFNVEEASSNELSSKYENIKVVHGKLNKVNDKEKYVIINPDIRINYEYLYSIEYFIERLRDSKRIAVVGNGGIASEIIYKIQNTDIDWIIKDNHISSTFVDPGAGEFFQSSLHKSFKTTEESPNKRMRYDEESGSKSGAALGPDWYKHFQIKGASELPPQVKIHYKSEITDVKINPDRENPVEITLNNGGN
ncbi:pyridine nucleotide-disulfide oxidoreductase domain-containing [Holotrichia oblita]|uniref:Pyridine nucleotide-disulfide oxidoreductase domain-containing n=1 Tax=Holotrichia oblita TaxID=644536 RepID=A0ACB9TBF3_HOLOL|nr:pyridine nucleotide-disulfide oxidoreductase domain-containing [Holotrichia oblita]